MWVNDLYEPLYNFWCVLQKSSEELVCQLDSYKKYYDTSEKARELFAEMKTQMNSIEISEVQRASAFYVVNKCSFSGLTESSSFSEQASVSNFSLLGIEKLSGYSEIIKNWRITNVDYKQLMDCDRKVFMYLDPPYDIKDNLYGRKGSMHKSFDHDLFAENCKLNMNMPMCISYNASNSVKDRFMSGGWTDAEFAHTYTMRSVGCYNTEQASRKELVLINYEN